MLIKRILQNLKLNLHEHICDKQVKGSISILTDGNQ